MACCRDDGTNEWISKAACLSLSLDFNLGFELLLFVTVVDALALSCSSLMYRGYVDIPGWIVADTPLVKLHIHCWIAWYG